MALHGRILPRSFYTRPTLTVAPELLGKTLVYQHPDGTVAGDIVEVEAYIGEDDPACHAAPGKTVRNAIMYDIGGHSYIYFVYGMYYCLNFTTEKKDFPAAILIRAVEPREGIEIMTAQSPSTARKLTNGPGKLCRAFGLTREHNGLDLTEKKLHVLDTGRIVSTITTSPRIGIKKAARRPWRFFLPDSDCVSRPQSHIFRPE